MNKKVLNIGIAFLFVFTFSPMITSAVEKTQTNQCSSCSNEADKHYLGELPPEEGWNEPSENIEQPVSYPLPTEWDWRNVEYNSIKGDWTTPIRHQGWCGSCWDFALHGAAESVISIREEDPDFNIDLSEQYMLSCSEGRCNGWYLGQAAMWMNRSGVLAENLFPYQARDEKHSTKPVKCNEKPEDYENYIIPIEDVICDGMHYSPLEKVKELLITKGPMATRIEVYDDFNGYDGGVYVYEGQLPKPSEVSYHDVVIVGYKDTPGNKDYDGYWIVKNSWGTTWGEDKNGNSWDENGDYIQDHEGGWMRVAYYTKGKFRFNYMRKIYTEAYLGYCVYYVEYEKGNIPYLYTDAKNNVKWFEQPGTNIEFEGIAGGGSKPYNYHWDFNDGTISNQKNPQHSFQKAGYYDVTLTVTDNDGTVNSDTDKIMIDTPPNDPVIEGPTKCKPNTAYLYNFSAIDPDGDDMKFTIYWSDNYSSKIETEFAPSGAVFQFRHTWSEDSYGTYYIEVVVTDTYDIWNYFELPITLEKKKDDSPKFTLYRFFEKYPLLFQILQTLLLNIKNLT